ncbi:MAG: polysaccharide biosynthesis tyrosine autokinase [Archaeoglobaceae archaeon]
MQEYQQYALVHQYEEGRPDIGFYMWVLRRRLPLILVVVFSSLLATMAYVSQAPKVYESVSMVRLRKQPLPAILQYPQQQESESLDLKTASQLVTTFLTSREALELIRKGKLLNMRIDDSTKKFAKSLNAQEVLTFVSVTSYEPDIIRISVKHTVPEVAAALANGLAEAFVNRLNREARQEATDERRFIENQLKIIQNQLQKIDKQVAEIKKQTGITDISEEVKVLVESVQNYTLELSTIEANLRSIEKILNLLQQALSQEPPFTFVRKENPILIEMEKQLAELELQKENLLIRYLPTHPAVKRIDQQIASLKREISKRQSERVIEVPDATPNQRYEILYQQLLEAERRKAELEERQKALRELIRQTLQKLSKFPEKQHKLSSLTRQLQVLEQAYVNLLSRLQEAQVREASKPGIAIIADVATVPNRPLGPSVFKFLSFALVMGMVTAIALVFLLESVRTVVRSVEEVRYLLGIPVLSTVPEVEDVNLNNFESLFKFMLSHHEAAEAIRMLRSNLVFLTLNKLEGGRSGKVFLVTSSIPKEGKSFISATLSIAFAQAGKKVILVDIDMRDPSIHKLLGFEVSPGLAEVLMGIASPNETIRSFPDLENLCALAVGKLPREGVVTPAELLDSKEMFLLLQELKERFDVVILDAPPLSMFVDPYILAPMTDGVLLVIEINKATREILKEIKGQLDLTQIKLIGAIVNKISYKNTYGYYQYRYYYYKRK